MRIGLFTDTYYPQVNGVATSTYLLKQGLERIGHNVYVFTTTDANATPNEQGVYRIPSISVMSERRLALFYQPHLVRLIKRLNLDIIHTQTEFSLGIFGRLMAKRFNIPLTHTYHTIYEDYTHYIAKFSQLNPIAKFAAKRISVNFCRAADQLIVPTVKVKNLLASYGVHRPINVIPTGINLEKFSQANIDSQHKERLRATLSIQPDDKVILFVGRVSKEKNIETLLLHVQPYLKEHPHIKFVIVGDGPYRACLEELTNELAITQQVIFAGEQPWESINQYYQIGDVFVSASQSETQGLTYIEALAAGLPVIAKADPCLNGVIENGQNGFTFHHQADFLSALNSVLENERYQTALATTAVMTAKRFSAEQFAQSVLEIYSSTSKISLSS
ncbi:1,2-diacylglycerol 3-alpha-glucosyltransferase [Amphibacillus marinus]|uniref:1,2-diacylglycerol 3-alpha-glucosyltransferase n=1 Tax=Amphibacillus marinus TaxID=872970 RepID=A0A1H8TBX2_9BACI|nr:glycosyltransferase family 4 protein [Amphibacillus marinus]SEO88381.1 1,2-diacylglycerol 3-alpha-glucosyltransferase [Amphibacillus marinus]